MRQTFLSAKQNSKNTKITRQSITWGFKSNKKNSLQEEVQNRQSIGEKQRIYFKQTDLNINLPESSSDKRELTLDLKNKWKAVGVSIWVTIQTIFSRWGSTHCNPSTQKVKVGSSHIWGQSGSYRETLFLKAKGWEHHSVVEHLPSTHKALGSVPSRQTYTQRICLFSQQSGGWGRRIINLKASLSYIKTSYLNIQLYPKLPKPEAYRKTN